MVIGPGLARRIAAARAPTVRGGTSTPPSMSHMRRTHSRYPATTSRRTPSIAERSATDAGEAPSESSVRAASTRSSAPSTTSHPPGVSDQSGARWAKVRRRGTPVSASGGAKGACARLSSLRARPTERRPTKSALRERSSWRTRSRVTPIAAPTRSRVRPQRMRSRYTRADRGSRDTSSPMSRSAAAKTAADASKPVSAVPAVRRGVGYT